MSQKEICFSYHLFMMLGGLCLSTSVSLMTCRKWTTLVWSCLCPSWSVLTRNCEMSWHLWFWCLSFTTHLYINMETCAHLHLFPGLSLACNVSSFRTIAMWIYLILFAHTASFDMHSAEILLNLESCTASLDILVFPCSVSSHDLSTQGLQWKHESCPAAFPVLLHCFGGKEK